MNSDPVRLYATDDPRLSRRMAQRLKDAHAKALNEVILAQDWADFTARRARVYALVSAIEICTEEEDELGQ